MNMFDALGASAPKSFPRWSAPVAGLVAAAVVAYIECRLPARHGLSWAGLIGSAAERVLLVSLASGMTVWVLCRIQQDKGNVGAHPLVLRGALDAAWLAPLALLIRENSAWAVAIAAVLVSRVTRSFCSLQDRPEKINADEPLILSLTSNAFGLPVPSQRYWRLLRGVFAALCTEFGVLVGFAGYTFMAVTLVGVSFAAWTWSFTVGEGSRNQELRTASESRLRAALALALAIVLTGAGLTPYLKHVRRFGGLGVPSASKSRHGFSLWKQPGEIGREKASEGSVSDFAEGHSGIVMWPKKQIHTTLVAPAPLFGNSLLSGSHSTKPLVVPFDGVYWLFRPPDVRPPRGSRELHGSPEMFNTRSTDRRPLSMEAHQYLGTMIDLGCCSRIQVAIRNADRYPDTVSLELILTNTSLPGKPSQSLGSVMVKSTPPWQLYGDRPSVSETLPFEIPANPAILRFDEVAIVFHLDANRADSGAKISIKQFVLVPRGL
jgi:hypothetical protein